jgi:ABC-type uncharacterized transport system auxiliary subunit
MRTVSIAGEMRRSASLVRRCLPARLLLGLSLAAIVALLAACGSGRPIKYYQISYPTAMPRPAADAINTTLLVRPLEASHLYLNDSIVYGFDSPEMGTYMNQRWVAPPVEMLQESLVRGLRASGRFHAVYTLRADPSGGQFILGGQLYDFKEVDGASIVARLSFEVRLRDRKNGVTVWNFMYNHDEPAGEKTVSAVAEAMNKNVQRSVAEVQTALEEYFREHPVH